MKSLYPRNLRETCNKEITNVENMLTKGVIHIATEYLKIFNVFYDKIEMDDRFFNYFHLTPEESMELANTRALSYLKESVVRFSLECNLDFLITFDDVLNQISVDLTNAEIQILGALMFEAYLGRNVAKLKVFSVSFTPQDLKVFSPAEERRTFMDMYQSVKQENEALLSNYKSRNRLTYERKGIDYDSYNSDE